MNLLIHAVLNITMHSQTLPNIYETFPNIYHLYLSSTGFVFQMVPGNALYHHNINLMEHFEFTDRLRMIYLALSNSEKLHQQVPKTPEICSKVIFSYFSIILSKNQLEKVIFNQI